MVFEGHRRRRDGDREACSGRGSSLGCKTRGTMRPSVKGVHLVKKKRNYNLALWEEDFEAEQENVACAGACFG